MRRVHRIVLSAGLIALLLLLVWLLFNLGPRRRDLSMGLTTAQGHFPEPGLVYDDQLVVLWVTNTGRLAVTLDEPYSQSEYAAGRLVTDFGSSWNQEGYCADLKPGSAAWLAYGFDQHARLLRVCFDYHRDGGPLLAMTSKVAGILPLKRLPQGIYDWLRRKGIVDGRVHNHYESQWVANPQGRANGRQPIRSDTNQASTAAASRPSP
jgi:hypothetical protein